MTNAGLFVLLLSVASVYSQPDQTACDNGGAYDTSKGTASCGGKEVNFFDLVCGQGFSLQSCVAKWTNPSGDEEDYFFMGVGAGIAVSDLPPSCSGITIKTPLAMVQYYPSNGGCYPAADLQGTQASYTPSGDGKSIQSVTLTFAEHDDGSNVRDGYMKITCGDQTSGFTTNGDTDVSSKYEVQVTGPCTSAPIQTTKPALTTPDPTCGGHAKSECVQGPAFWCCDLVTSACLCDGWDQNALEGFCIGTNDNGYIFQDPDFCTKICPGAPECSHVREKQQQLL